MEPTSEPTPQPITVEILKEQWLPSLRRTIVPLVTIFIINLIGAEYIDEGAITQLISLLFVSLEYGLIRLYEIKKGAPTAASYLIGGKTQPSYKPTTTSTSFSSRVGAK